MKQKSAMLSETALFIHQPVASMIKAAEPATVHEIIEDGNVVIYKFAAGGVEAPFGFSADTSTELSKEWTRLLHIAPRDNNELASVLVELGVAPEQVQPLTDRNGEPLIDMQEVRSLLSVKRPTARYPIVREPLSIQAELFRHITSLPLHQYPAPDGLRTYVIVDAKQHEVSDLSKFIAAGIEDDLAGVVVINSDDHRRIHGKRRMVKFFVRRALDAYGVAIEEPAIGQKVMFVQGERGEDVAELVNSHKACVAFIDQNDRFVEDFKSKLDENSLIRVMQTAVEFPDVFVAAKKMGQF